MRKKKAGEPIDLAKARARKRKDRGGSGDPASGGEVVRVMTPAEEAVRWMTAGADRTTLLEAIAAKHPEASPEKVLEEAAQMVAGTVYQPMDFLIGKCFLQLEELHHHLRGSGDFVGAVGAVSKKMGIIQLLLRERKKKQPGDDAMKKVVVLEATEL